MRTISAAILIAFAGLSATAQAEQFTSATGSFTREGKYWVEQPSGARFEELFRNAIFVQIRDASRNINIELPFKGGMARWGTPETLDLNDLANVDYVP